ncbi:class I SAM-dependent methyltransferase [Pelagibacterium luteolum]|nr:class I SAM-dependent methyltransferase [Pelagibacterium luteolum]
MEPRRVVEPLAWAGHIPFAFWLVEVLRPKCIVELGTHTGNSFCAFAQAVEAFEIDAKVFAVDHWQGDEHAGAYSKDVFAELSQYIETLYPQIASMVRSSFDEALPEFADKSIDLLHIDGMHTYEAVRQDFLAWLPKVASNGIVLFHDTAVTERNFGVGAFLKELSADYQVFDFHHSHGLGVVAIGAVPQALAPLFNNLSDSDGLDAATVFEMLGNGVLTRAHADRFSTHSDVRICRPGPAQENPKMRERLDLIANFFHRQNELRSSYRSPFVATEQAYDLLVARILSSGYFSPRFYASQLGSTDLSDRELCRHYLSLGEKEGRLPSHRFNPSYYAEANPDVASSRYGLLEHFVLLGRLEGRHGVGEDSQVIDAAKLSAHSQSQMKAQIPEDTIGAGEPIELAFEQLSNEMSRAQDQLTQAREQLEQTRQSEQAAKDALENTSQRLRAIENSRLWRMTAGLRAVIHKMRGN